MKRQWLLCTIVMLGVSAVLPAVGQEKTGALKKDHKTASSQSLMVHKPLPGSTSMKAHSEMTRGSTVHTGLLHGSMVHGKLRRGKLHATLAHGHRLHTTPSP